MKKIKNPGEEHIGNTRYPKKPNNNKKQTPKSLTIGIGEGEESQQNHRRKQLHTKERHTHRDKSKINTR